MPPPDASPPARPPPRALSLLGQSLLVGLGVPALFVLYIGPEALPFSLAITAFLLVLVLLPPLLERLSPRPSPGAPAKGSRLDSIAAVVWLLSSSFGALAGWALTSAPTLTESNWRLLAGARVLLAFALPAASLLWMLRTARGGLVGAAVLTGLTALPIASSLPAAFDLIHGPRLAHGALRLPGLGRTLDR